MSLGLPILDTDPEGARPIIQAALAHDMNKYLALISSERAKSGFYDLGEDHRLSKDDMEEENVGAVEERLFKTLTFNLLHSLVIQFF